ncbi:MAG TPA: hypothetical protein VGT03_02850 [Candidatus Acidoferrales bacterium]|nr:hypothetical protein [Candidatus Acidoferrales bacterium]
MTVTNSGRLTGQVVPRRTRWLAIAAGCLSGLAGSLSFGPLMFAFSLLLILGAIVQPWWHRPGRWLLAFGAFIQTFYSFLFVLPGAIFIIQSPPLLQGDSLIALIALPLIPTSVALVVWCDIALIVDARRSGRIVGSEQHFPNVGDWIVWTIAVSISIPVVRGIPAYVYVYRHGRLDIFLTSLAFELGIAALDVALVISVVKKLRSRRSQNTGRGPST